MHIDPFSIIIFTIIISLLTIVGMFVQSRNYEDIKGIRHWAAALLLQTIGWSLLALIGFIPDFFSMVIGTTLLVASPAFYFYALIAFKDICVPVRWTYWVLILAFIGQVCFVIITFDIAAKVIVTSLSVAILLFANSLLLLNKQQGVCSASHRFTGSVFAIGSGIYFIRAIYYWGGNIQVGQTLFHNNFIQDISFLYNPIITVGTAFGFTLMCNEKYLIEKNQAQLLLGNSVSLLNAALESTADALLIVGLTGNVIQYNALFVKMWGIPESILNTKNDKLLLEFVLDQLVDKEGFINGVLDTYKHLHQETFSEVHFKDGRIIERYSRPQYLDNEPVGRVWSFRDVSERKRIEQALKLREERFQILFDRANDGIAILKPCGQFVKVNDSYARIHGYTVQEMLAMGLSKLMSPPASELLPERIQRILSGESLIFESEHHHKKGHIFPLEVSASLIISNGESLIQAFVRDITERKQAETEIFEMNTRLSLAQEATDAGVWDWNLSTNQAIWNDQMFIIYGLPSTVPMPFQMWISIVHPEDVLIVEDSLQRALLNKCADQIEYRIIRPNGELRYVSSAKTVLLDTEGNVTRIIGMNFDITERKIAEETIKKLAFYDPLTLLPNRRLLNERIKHGIEINHRTGKQMAVLMMDLDKFKAVNDTLGHAAGDELLKKVAERIKTRLREVDMVVRLGGDEFVIFIEEVQHYEVIAQVAEQIIHSLSQPFILSETYDVTIGASIGIAIHPSHGESLEELIDNADTALYKAKDSGRGCFAYFSDGLIKRNPMGQSLTDSLP